MKWARPPRGANDASASRKRRSFDVETTFYRTLAPRCDETCRVPALLAARGGEESGEWVLVLEDLDKAGFDGPPACHQDAETPSHETAQVRHANGE